MTLYEVRLDDELRSTWEYTSPLSINANIHNSQSIIYISVHTIYHFKDSLILLGTMGRLPTNLNP